MTEESEPEKLLEISLKVGDSNMYKQILFDRLEDVTYDKLVSTWKECRPISEVRTFVWVRNDQGYQKRFLIQDDDDLRAALRTESTIVIGAMGHGNFEWKFALGVVLFVLFHIFLNLSVLWPLCRGDMWSLCLTSDTKIEVTGL